MLALSVAITILAAFAGPADGALGQGLMAGEVTTDSVLLQTRITAGVELRDGDFFDDGDALRDGDMPGAAGAVRILLSADPLFPHGEGTRASPRLEATADHDFIIRHRFGNLEAGTRYYYRIEFEKAATPVDDPSTELIGSFRTLPGDAMAAPIRFHVVTGMNYDKFHHSESGYKGDDRGLGFPALDAMRELDPDFIVFTGDNVYYDNLPRVKTLADMRAKWHRLFAQPRMIELLSRVPAYWEKDDHDFRFNDCDTTGDKFPASPVGIATFREQMPVVAQNDSATPTYRTHRVSRDLQIWLIEGRDQRSPNTMADGPEKSLWGEVQRAWLMRTLVESDATFKVIISPTPMLGPDDAYKRDNHTNENGFRYEGSAFLNWAEEQGLWEAGLFLVCGDRHWQYHSIHPTGAQEFSCGAICDANSRLGRRPGEPRSTDPEAQLLQPYRQQPASGGFLSVVVEPATKDAPAGTDAARPALRFEFFNERGELLYEFEHR